MNTKIIIGILGVLLVLSNGAQYMLNDTGKSLRCSTGWTFVETGEFEGQYMCKTATTLRYSYCSRTWDTKTGRKNYYCAEAIPVFIESEEKGYDSSQAGEQWSCPVGGECVRI